MAVSYVVHIVAGGCGLVLGAVALSTAKGGRLHRQSGMGFVYAMLTMGFLGALMAAVQGKSPAVNIPAAVLTAYLVITALTTVRPSAAWSGRLTLGLLLVVVVVSLTNLAFGIEAAANGGRRQGIPAFPFFLFAVVGTLAGIGDVRVLRAGPLQGPPRLARHLWRMCFALFIAAMSFFIGQAKVIPKPIRIYPLLAAPPLLVLVAMFYWLRRVRARRGAAPGRSALPRRRWSRASPARPPAAG